MASLRTGNRRRKRQHDVLSMFPPDSSRVRMYRDGFTKAQLAHRTRYGAEWYRARARLLAWGKRRRNVFDGAMLSGISDAYMVASLYRAGSDLLTDHEAELCASAGDA